MFEKWIDTRPAAHVMGKTEWETPERLCATSSHALKELIDRFSFCLQELSVTKKSLRLCAGIHMWCQRSPQGALRTVLRTALCKSASTDATTFTRGWSSSSMTAPLLTILCLWGGTASLYPRSWWRATGRVSAPCGLVTPGPRRVTWAPPCSCRNMTGCTWTCPIPGNWPTNLTPTSLASTRSKALWGVGRERSPPTTECKLLRMSRAVENVTCHFTQWWR